VSAAISPATDPAGQPWRLVLLEPLRWLAARPPLAWLAPRQTVRLLRADGSQALWLGDRPVTGDPAGAPFTAVELPEDRVLRRVLRLPALSPQDVRSAVAVEAVAASPFERTDLVYGWRADEAPGGGLLVQIAVSGRRPVAQTLAERLGDAPRAEVWVLDERQRPVVLEGYGEAARRRRGDRGAWVGYALLLLALALAAALAVTPTVKLKLRAMQAAMAWSALEPKAATPLAQRDTLVRLQDDLLALQEATADRVDPLAVMDLLTRLVPDDTWLQRLQVQGARVVISGQTPNTAALMNTLSTHPDVKDVRAPNPATRAMGGTRENFTVELTLAPRTPAASAPVDAGGHAGAGPASTAAPPTPTLPPSATATTPAASPTARSRQAAPAGVPA